MTPTIIAEQPTPQYRCARCGERVWSDPDDTGVTHDLVPGPGHPCYGLLPQLRQGGGVMTATTVLAWHNDPDLKAAAVTRMREHAAADRLIRGRYLDTDAASWGGCLHGCLTAETLAAEHGTTLRALEDHILDWHAESERLWGIPEQLGALLDDLYERSDTAPGELAVQILEAIPPGAHLAPVVDRLMLLLLADPSHGVRQHTAEGSAQRAAVDQVAGLYRRRLIGDDPSYCQWAAARAAAGDAAGDAAWAAWAARAAWDAAGAAGAAGAAWAAAAWDWAAAGDAWCRWWQQQVLIHLAQQDQAAAVTS